MRLHRTLTNNQCVGKTVTAKIAVGQPWVTYQDGNDGEKDFYRDVIINGYCAYMDGESCTILDYDDVNETVTLRGEFGEPPDEGGYDGVFTIPYSQYYADFYGNI